MRAGAIDPARRAPRREAAVVGVAAGVSLLLSPITAVWAIVLGVPVALLAWGIDRLAHQPAARTVMLIALGVVLGAAPYFLAAAAIAAF
jgi:hypothetical protein